MTRKQRRPRRLWLIVGVPVLVLALLYAGGRILTPAGPMPEALAALQPDDRVQVTAEDWFVFSPAESRAATGFIYYPGGRVDARAYAPYARDIAAEGYLTVVVPMPLALAVLAPNRAAEVMAAFPEIESWVVGGHSLGGAMAAQFAAGQVDKLAGLALIASYPAESNDLSGRDDLAAVSIYGSADGLAEPETVEASRVRLPQTAQFIRIEGGNHAQFGWYGPQAGDNPASISHEAQQNQTVEAVLKLLADVAAR